VLFPYELTSLLPPPCRDKFPAPAVTAIAKFGRQPGNSVKEGDRLDSIVWAIERSIAGQIGSRCLSSPFAVVCLRDVANHAGHAEPIWTARHHVAARRWLPSAQEERRRVAVQLSAQEKVPRNPLDTAWAPA
jgi:hypothetical protein